MSNASRINPTASRKWLAARRELLLNSLAQPVVSPDRLFNCSPVLCVTSHTPDHDKTLLQRQITTTDKQIDRLVYELYGLSDDEIGIVEGVE